MIALGGVIGAGLFVGSGAGIAAAGPSIVVAYTPPGLLVMLVMRMLGEMSAAYPSSGSFSAHAERAIGPGPASPPGWAFWVLLCTAVGLEGIGAAAIVHGWLPGTPEWVWVALFMVVFCGTNLAAVKNFGEFEFWFAALKVGAISLFLVLGVLAIAGILPGTDSPGTSHLSDFLPNGGNGLIIGLLASVFAYGGLETVTIAAAESENPVKGVASAVRTAMWRIALFYIGSMAVIVTLVPWDSKEVVEKGPYVAALDELGIPGAGQLMNVVVLVALLSAMNANIYGASRIGYSLVERGQGPKALGRVSGGVPRIAVLVSSLFGFGCVLLSYWRPDDVFSLAAEHDRRGHPGRLDLHRRLPAAVAPPAGAGGAREAGRAHVGLPVPDLGGAGGHGHGVRADGPGAGHAGAAVLDGRDDAGPGGRRLRVAAATGARLATAPQLFQGPRTETDPCGGPSRATARPALPHTVSASCC